MFDYTVKISSDKNTSAMKSLENNLAHRHILWQIFLLKVLAESQPLHLQYFFVLYI